MVETRGKERGLTWVSPSNRGVATEAKGCGTATSCTSSKYATTVQVSPVLSGRRLDDLEPSAGAKKGSLAPGE